MRFRLGTLAAFLSVVLVGALTHAYLQHVPPAPTFGVTFSTLYARQLGIDERAAFIASMDDLGLAAFRIPLYWSDIERRDGDMHWESYDWMMDEAAHRGAQVTLVLGAKVPRWPECFVPEWAQALGEEGRQEQQLAFVQAAVQRYAPHPALARWQIENEPMFPFGECPKPDHAFLKQEHVLVRLLDAGHPVQVTVSGEFEPHVPWLEPADIVGLSLYRIAWNDIVGYSPFVFPPEFYRARSWLLHLRGEQAIISELQAEPWFPIGVNAETSVSWYDAFDADLLERHVEFAKRSRVSEAYLWGVEWWYFLKTHGEPRLWDAARNLLRSDVL